MNGDAHNCEISTEIRLAARDPTMVRLLCPSHAGQSCFPLSLVSFPRPTFSLVSGIQTWIIRSAAMPHHEHSGALLAGAILARLGMDPVERAIVMGAIGNHEEETGEPVSEVGAALIIADKSDVHRTRVRNPDPRTFDLHDRVNYAVQHSFLRVDDRANTMTLELTIDTGLLQVMEYFEIFLSRMVACRRAATFLGSRFKLQINGTKLL